MTTPSSKGLTEPESRASFDESVRANKVQEIEKLGFGVKDVADAIERYGTGTILVATGISLFVLIVLGIIGLNGSEFLDAVIITGVMISAGTMVHLYTYNKQMEFASRKLAAIESANQFHREQLLVGEKALHEQEGPPLPGQSNRPAQPDGDPDKRRSAGWR